MKRGLSSSGRATTARQLGYTATPALVVDLACRELSVGSCPSTELSVLTLCSAASCAPSAPLSRPESAILPCLVAGLRLATLRRRPAVTECTATALATDVVGRRRVRKPVGPIPSSLLDSHCWAVERADLSTSLEHDRAGESLVKLEARRGASASWLFERQAPVVRLDARLMPDEAGPVS